MPSSPSRTELRHASLMLALDTVALDLLLPAHPREGRLRAQKIGRNWVVLEEDVDSLAQSYEARRGRPRKQVTKEGGRQSYQGVERLWT